MNIEIVKKHPVITGLVFVAGAVVLYMLVKHSSASAPSSGTSDAQLQALSTAEGLAAAQYNSQLQIAQISGSVASEQTQAQLAAVRLETDAAQSIVATQTSGAVQQTQIQYDSTTEQERINAEAQKDIAHDYFNTSLAAHQAEIDAATAISNKNFDIANQVVLQAGKDKSRSSTGWAQILSALQGRGPEAIAANQPSQVAGANIAGNIFGGITKGIFSLFA